MFSLPPLSGPEIEILLLIYHLIIIPAIVIDLYVGQKMSHEMRLKDALLWVAIWIGLASAWGMYIFLRFGTESSALYFASYIVEYSLSMDNLFVFLTIFEYFSVALKSQHKVLYIGIITAIVLRGLFILGGITLIEMYHWVIYIFAAIVIYTGIKVARAGEVRAEPERNPIVSFASKHFPIVPKYRGSSFIIRDNNKLFFTPLILVLLAIETTDVMFAFDSIPAVITLTQNFFIAYTSNISAVLGLRSLYFVLAMVMLRLKYFGQGIAIVLIFIGVKIFLTLVGIKVPLMISLLVIFGVIIASILLSIFKRD